MKIFFVMILLFYTSLWGQTPKDSLKFDRIFGCGPIKDSTTANLLYDTLKLSKKEKHLIGNWKPIKSNIKCISINNLKYRYVLLPDNQIVHIQKNRKINFSDTLPIYWTYAKDTLQMYDSREIKGKKYLFKMGAYSISKSKKRTFLLHYQALSLPEKYFKTKEEYEYHKSRIDNYESCNCTVKYRKQFE